MKIFAFILSLVIILAAILILINNQIPKTPTAEINGHVFSLYLAKTSQEQEVGLSKFTRINNNQGMLFIFQRKDYFSFWMKGMKFPIDIIFINGCKIVDIFQNVPVPTSNTFSTYTTRQKADKVIEINAGLTKEYGIKAGDIVNLNL
jgi:uncharacterized membrane protein (UPF0127 family)